MPRIRCHYVGCMFIEDGFCGAPVIEIDPDEGCRTFMQTGDPFEEDWDEDDDFENWDEEDFESDAWLDSDEF